MLQPGGKLLLLATEDTFNGALTSQLWHCRTYNRSELLGMCDEAGLHLVRELWFSRLHRILRLGGIIIELRNTADHVHTITRDPANDYGEQWLGLTYRETITAPERSAAARRAAE